MSPGNKSKDLLVPDKLADRIGDLMIEKLAKEVLVLNLKGLTNITDYFVICSAESAVQVKAIVDHVKNELARENNKPFHIDGYRELRWVLLDYVDVVVHVFLPEVREYYGLERMWADANIFEMIDAGQ